MSNAGKIYNPITRKPRRVLLALSWYSHEIHRGVARYAKKAGWLLDRSVHRYCDVPQNWQGDGILCSTNPAGKIKKIVDNARLPTVNMGGWYPGLNLPTVIHDDFEIGRQAAEHFINRDFTELAFYLRSSSQLARTRREGFEMTAQKAGCNCYRLDWHSYRQSSSLTNPSAKHWLIQKILSLPKPLAIFADNDDHALELIDACMHAGVPVPQQVAILGCDNDELDCTVSPIPISSVNSDLEGLGYKSAELLDQLLQGRQIGTRFVKIPPKGIVVRKSSDIKAIAHPQVATALCYIWDNYYKPIQVEDVVKAVSMSRRGLYDAFSKFVGHSIAEEITRFRLDKATHLLTSTNKKASEIAAQSGFTSSDRMGKVFMRVFKMSPSAYRKAHSKESLSAGIYQPVYREETAADKANSAKPKEINQ